MKHILVYLSLVAGLLVSCQRTSQFTIEGVVSHAEGQTLYLEHTALMQTSVVDSCVLTAKGDFLLKASAPQYPDFYRLRIGRNSLILAIDSTEVITITATRDSLANTLAIENSDNTLMIAQLRAMAHAASREDLREEAKKIIVANPRSLAAYYAVFMKQNGEYIWNIFDPSDRRMFQAVATSFHTWMPNYERTKALYTQVKEVM